MSKTGIEKGIEHVTGAAVIQEVAIFILAIAILLGICAVVFFAVKRMFQES